MYVTNYYICISNSDISWNFNCLFAICTCLTGISNLTCSKQHPQFPAPTLFPIAVHGNSILPVAQVKNPWKKKQKKKHGIILSLTHLFFSHSVSILINKSYQLFLQNINIFRIYHSCHFHS